MNPYLTFNNLYQDEETKNKETNMSKGGAMKKTKYMSKVVLLLDSSKWLWVMVLKNQNKSKKVLFPVIIISFLIMAITRASVEKQITKAPKRKVRKSKSKRRKKWQ